MTFTTTQIIVKLSVSNMLNAIAFYESILGLEIDPRYTLNSDGEFGQNSYVQMFMRGEMLPGFSLGLYKDIDAPLKPLPQVGTVPSFVVPNINATLERFLVKGVVVDKDGDPYIISNTSDEGFTDHFFFFRDLDNNSLVIRQNIPKH